MRSIPRPPKYDHWALTQDRWLCSVDVLVKKVIKSEYRRIREEGIVTYLKVQSRNIPKGTDENEPRT
jgi:hypothetical protein